MVLGRLLLLFLILLQSGLMTRPHAQTCSIDRRCHHSDNSHVHAFELLNFLTPELGDDDQDEGEDHDLDAFDMSDFTTPHVDANANPVETALLHASAASIVVGFSGYWPFLIGLPPSTAGPPQPLYLTFCSFRN
ncbi:MAG: hypothetical protein C0467_00465 [Planctomycetaceae bacterium]|nr:hypothetical protein [Planctomycetaceae bacterium]